MIVSSEHIDILRTVILFALASCAFAFLWAPLLTKLLYRYKITRNNPYDKTLTMDARQDKTGVPIMGGLLVIITVALITILFNWERKFTWMPIAVMLLSALLVFIDDVLNIFGERRRNRKLSHILRLIRVHNDWKQRVWLTITLPWALFKRTSLWLGSHPGRGLHVHERLLFQFTAGAITAWWIFFKLAESWRTIHIPFDGFINIGIWMIPLIIFFVMATANAVNVADGMDGLAGGSLLITFAALTVLAWIQGYPSIAFMNATIVGALLAYTYFNIKPARFQMGDVGSLGLGALLAVNTMVMNHMILLPLFGFIFYVELASVLIQVFGRHVLGRRIFRMAPIHYHFSLGGWGEEKVVMRFWVIHAAFVILGMWIALY